MFSALFKPILFLRNGDPEDFEKVACTPDLVPWNGEVKTTRLTPMGSDIATRTIRYRGFVLLAQINGSWNVRPERSPMTVLPFRTPTCSLEDVKALVDWKLSQKEQLIGVA